MTVTMDDVLADIRRLFAEAGGHADLLTMNDEGDFCLHLRGWPRKGKSPAEVLTDGGYLIYRWVPSEAPASTTVWFRAAKSGINPNFAANAILKAEAPVASGDAKAEIAAIVEREWLSLCSGAVKCRFGFEFVTPRGLSVSVGVKFEGAYP